jgi:hypothetical protein
MTAKTKNKQNPKAKPAKAKKAMSMSSKTISAKAAKPVTSASKPQSIVLGKPRATAAKPRAATTKVRVVNKDHPRIRPAGDRRHSKGLRIPQYNFMKPPGLMHDFQVGDTVEVYCDHEKNRDRVRGWIRGIVVQVDNKLVAVQFRSNVFLTDGWMVPDRILWYPLNSEHMRPVPGKKVSRREEQRLIPDY